jgi:hypothetical protein
MSELTRRECLSSFREAHRGTRSEAQAHLLSQQAEKDEVAYSEILRWLANTTTNTTVMTRKPNANPRCG